MIGTAIQLLLSIGLSIVFLASAIPKLRHPKGFILAVLEYRILPTRLSWGYARVLPPLELLLALLLLSGTAVRLAALMVSLLLLSFLLAVGINVARGRESPVLLLSCVIVTAGAAVLLSRSPFSKKHSDNGVGRK